MKIGTATLIHGLILAPMAGYTDRAMRLVCREHGAEYTVTEMVSAKAVVYEDKKTAALARVSEDEGAVAIQLFGKEPEIMAEAAKILTETVGRQACAIDINMGCPVKKIFSNGEGSALMKDPRLIEKITEAVRLATDKPVTVKLRAGIDETSRNAVECALAAEAGGASAICIHGRTRVEMYGGRADRRLIASVKEAIKIPLIANGDITSADEALDMFRVTDADAIAIGRGAVGNPFIFEEIAAALSGKEYTPPTQKERIDTALRQLELARRDKGESVAIPESRKQIALYFKGAKGAAAIRAAINRSQTYSEVEKILRSSELYEE